MKIELENLMRGFSFFCRLPDIKVAWTNPHGYVSLKPVQIQYLHLQILYRFQPNLSKKLSHAALNFFHSVFYMFKVNTKTSKQHSAA